MERGLDKLIDLLLSEIAFSGNRGCSVSHLLHQIGTFYDTVEATPGQPQYTRHSQVDGNQLSATPTGQSTSNRDRVPDSRVASRIWQWLVERPDVSVGVDKQFNHLSLEDVLSIPEGTDSVPSASNMKSSSASVPTTGLSESSDARSLTDKAPNTRPHLYVSEERQWKTITGHGPNLKRVPVSEWKALVEIASVREEGILQGDLVRLTGQDKRSIPTRTDALAKKGYIIKQPVLIRGCRTSKLWLAQFADNAKADLNREGLNLSEVDLSKEALTGNLDPVPFSDKWNGDRIDYFAIAQAFMAIVKAWGLIRYCDARTKLNVEERVPQMRALAKSSRWLTSIGALTFVAAKFANSQKLFRDCVKYVRDPTAAEWKVFRATPKARMNDPSQRVGARAASFRAHHKKARVRSSKPDEESVGHKSLRDQNGLSLWTPQKPFVNTAFEIIQRAGTNGSSNVAITQQTVGYAFRKYVSGLTTGLVVPNSQPTHLSRFEVTSQLKRVKKTMTYQFFAPDPSLSTPHLTEVQPSGADDPEFVKDHVKVQSSPVDDNLFSQPSKLRFTSTNSKSLSELCRASGTLQYLNHRMPKLAPKRKRLPEDGGADEPSPKRRERAPEGSRASRASSSSAGSETYQVVSRFEPQVEEPVSSPIGIGPLSFWSSPQQFPPAISQPRPPGVYRESNDYLTLMRRRKGRPKKSCIVTFRLDTLKNPSTLGDTLGQTLSEYKDTTLRHEPSAGDNPIENQHTTASRTNTPIKVAKSHISCEKPYKCDNCGNTWKNPGGLEYHLNKSQTSCNPAFVPPPPKPRPLPKAIELSTSRLRVSSNKQAYETVGDNGEKQLSPNKPFLPSKRVHGPDSGGDNEKPTESNHLHVGRNSILLRDVQVYQVVGRGREPDRHAPSSFQESFTSTAQKGNLPIETISQELQHGFDLGQKDKEQTAQSNDSVVTEAPKNMQPPGRKETESQQGQESVATSQDNHQSKEIETLDIDVCKPLPDSNKGSPGNLAVQREQQGATIVQSIEINRDQSNVKSLFGMPSKVASLGAQRRDRTSQIIQYILDHNNGVFPGDRAIYLAVISIWSKECSDLAPPDRRVCTAEVNKLDKANVLKQLHFLSLDPQGKAQECTVLVKVDLESDVSGLSADPRVTSVKEKMREMHPEVYIPPAFSLSSKEIELFESLSSRYRDGGKSDETTKLPEKSTLHDVEVLQYPKPVLVDALASTESPKRPVEDGGDGFSRAAKRARTDAGEPRGPRNAQNRRAMGEWIATSQLAKYVWDQRQHLRSEWEIPERTVACLQDSETGTWSRVPGPALSDGSTLDFILASVQRTKDIDASLRPRRAYNSRKRRDDTVAPSEGSDTVKLHSGALIFTNQFVEPSVSTSFTPEDAGSEAEDEDWDGDGDDDVSSSLDDIADTADKSMNGTADGVFADFTAHQSIHQTSKGYWPLLPEEFFESQSFSLAGTLPDGQWFLRENMPRDIHDILKTARGTLRYTSWLDPIYGRFLRNLNTIKRWEQSPGGSQLFMYGTLAPDYVFLNLVVDESKVNMRPVGLEWPDSSQFTPENFPDEIKHGSFVDDYFNPSSSALPGKARVSSTQKHQENKQKKKHPTALGKRFVSVEPRKKKAPKRMRKIEHADRYKTRYAAPIPSQSRSRIDQPRKNADRLPHDVEADLIAGFVVIKTILGGVDRHTDFGFIYRVYPEMSLTSLRKFWSRVCRERKTYVETLTTIFQSAFLVAYEKGEVPPLDFDNVDDYDWRSLITWASQLQTHGDVNLPESRSVLKRTQLLENPPDKATDWREAWFALTSVSNRIEAASKESLSTPIESSKIVESTQEIARSFIRSLCCTKLRDVDTPENIRAKLLKLADGDQFAANSLLAETVTSLKHEKIIVRSKGKLNGQSYRLHALFSKMLRSLSRADKFAQAAAFKRQLDESFQAAGESELAYAADEGAIMAVINLQAAGRIHLEGIDIPNIPFGFEPGNYEGRFFPKSYYHFKIRLRPTEAYVYDDDMPLLYLMQKLEIPSEGPQGEIPIWVDFFGRVDEMRWAEYVCAVIFALATKGPVTAKSAVPLLRPVIEEFEAKLIIDWLDRLALIRRFESEGGVTVGEWWWLVGGKVVESKAEGAVHMTQDA